MSSLRATCAQAMADTYIDYDVERSSESADSILQLHRHTEGHRVREAA